MALTVATRLLTTFAGFGVSIITARYLGPTGRGQYFFVITLSALIVQFANLGLHAANTYDVARDTTKLSALVTNSIWISLLLGGGCAAVAAVVAHFLDIGGSSASSALWLIVAITPPTLFWLLGTSLLVGMNRIVLFNVLEASTRVLALVVSLAAGALALGVAGFLGGYAVAWAVGATVLAVLLLRMAPLSAAFNPAAFRAGFRYATKAYVIAVLGFLVLRSTVFFLQHYWGSHELGLFSVAAQVVDVLLILPASVALVLMPNLVRSRGAAWATTVRTACIVGVLVALLCAIVGAAATPFMRIAFGSDFEPAASVLRLMLPGVLFVSVTTVFSQFLASIGMPRSLIGVWLIGLGVLLLLAAVLVPGHAAAGAAEAFSLAYVVLMGMIIALSWHHRRRLLRETRPLSEPAVLTLEEGTRP